MAPSNFLPPQASSTRFLCRTPSFGKPAYVSRFLHSNNSHASPLGFLSPRFCLLSSFMVNLPEIASVFLTYHLRLAHCTPAGRLHVTVDLPRTSSPRALLISPPDTWVLLLAGALPQFAPSPGGAPGLSVYSPPSRFPRPHPEDQHCPAWGHTPPRTPALSADPPHPTQRPTQRPWQHLLLPGLRPTGP